MIKLIAAVTIIMLVTVGCGTGAKQIRIRSEVQEVQVPLLYCPAPPAISAPSLPIHNMTPEQLSNPGEVVKHYKATVKTLLGYIDELEQGLGSYDETSKEYGELREKFLSDWKKESEDTVAE